MRRTVTAAIMAAILAASLLAQSGTAAAGLEWCSEDPLVTVNGTVLTLTTSWPTPSLSSVNVVAYVIDVDHDAVVSYTIPANEPARATVSFRRHGESGTVGAQVTVRATSGFPVILTARGGTAPVGATGVSNAAVGVTITLPGGAN